MFMVLLMLKHHFPIVQKRIKSYSISSKIILYMVRKRRVTSQTSQSLFDVPLVRLHYFSYSAQFSFSMTTTTHNPVILGQAYFVLHGY